MSSPEHTHLQDPPQSAKVSWRLVVVCVLICGALAWVIQRYGYLAPAPDAYRGSSPPMTNKLAKDIETIDSVGRFLDTFKVSWVPMSVARHLGAEPQTVPYAEPVANKFSKGRDGSMSLYQNGITLVSAQELNFTLHPSLIPDDRFQSRLVYKHPGNNSGGGIFYGNYFSSASKPDLVKYYYGQVSQQFSSADIRLENVGILTTIVAYDQKTSASVFITIAHLSQANAFPYALEPGFMERGQRLLGADSKQACWVHISTQRALQDVTPWFSSSSQTPDKS